jgi:phosphatidylserine/phosphatidylglycerophosphate/cardiolipin synthase-like enzyme
VSAANKPAGQGVPLETGRTSGGSQGQPAIEARFLAEGEQTAVEVAGWLADFIRGAQQSLDIAIYDFRLSNPLKTVVAGALHERAAAGVRIRIAYDADKPPQPDPLTGIDPAPAGTGAFVQALGYPWRRIGGLKLMHNKYLLRDAGTPTAAVWTGSTNLTDDSWTLQENNLLILPSAQLAAYYAEDFEDLWRSGDIEETGAFDTTPASLTYAGTPANVQVWFSPGRGPAIDYDVARQVACARARVRLCTMLINSSALISALGDLLRAGRVEVNGVYDQTQMEEVLVQWQGVPHNHWKIGAVQDIIADAGLIGKRSTPYSPTSRHDFMHNKVLVVDDTVITGSYNFSHSAEQNAENLVIVENAALADAYSAYIDRLIGKYQSR